MEINSNSSAILVSTYLSDRDTLVALSAHWLVLVHLVADSFSPIAAAWVLTDHPALVVLGHMTSYSIR
jgi:hypothetical protein